MFTCMFGGLSIRSETNLNMLKKMEVAEEFCGKKHGPIDCAWASFQTNRLGKIPGFKGIENFLQPIDWHPPTIDCVNLLILRIKTCSAVNRLTPLYNRLVFGFLLKMKMWTQPIDCASLTNQLAHAFCFISCFLMFLNNVYQLLNTCHYMYALNH